MLGRLYVAAVLMAGGCAQAACDLALGIPDALTPADSIAWSGCDGSGTGVQRALDFVAEAGGGSVQLSGSGSLLVGSPLRVRNRTTLYGDPARGPYGMVVVGDSADGACNPAPGYRDRDCPVIQVFGQTASPASGANITIYNLHIDGGAPGRPLHNAISVQQSSKVSIVYNRISGVRWKGIEDADTVETLIDYLSLEMARGTGLEPETGGAGVWISRSTNATLQNSILTSPTYFDTGLPDSDPRHVAGAAATMDLVAALGTTGTRIVGNTILAGNTAGIYLAADLTARVSRAIVANNTVTNVRQHGVDLANCDGVDVTGNTITNAGDAGISIADCHNGYFQGNTISGAARNAGYYIPRGSFMLNWGATNNTITGNEVRASYNAEYSVHIASDNPAYGSTARNAFTCNNLTSGSMGVFGGELTGETIPALDRTGRPFRCHPAEAER